MREVERRAALDAFKASAADYKQTVLQAFGQIADILQVSTHDANLVAAQKHALSTASEAIRPVSFPGPRNDRICITSCGRRLGLIPHPQCV
jgi:hypothetical protein